MRGWILTKFIVVNISQCINMSNHHVELLKGILYFMSIISQWNCRRGIKLEKQKNPATAMPTAEGCLKDEGGNARTQGSWLARPGPHWVPCKWQWTLGQGHRARRILPLTFSRTCDVGYIISQWQQVITEHLLCARRCSRFCGYSGG